MPTQAKQPVGERRFPDKSKLSTKQVEHESNVDETNVDETNVEERGPSLVGFLRETSEGRAQPQSDKFIARDNLMHVQLTQPSQAIQQ